MVDKKLLAFLLDVFQKSKWQKFNKLDNYYNQ